MKTQLSISGYCYGGAGHSCAHAILLPALETELKAVEARVGSPSRLFDLGCGNGSAVAALAGAGK